MSKNITIHGLRGFSALLVVIDHIYYMSIDGGFFKSLGGSNLGGLGVHLFFIISGFLIIQSLLKHSEVNNFLWNRIIRIYPVFLFLHLGIFAFGPIINYEWFAGINFPQYTINFLSNLFLLPGIFPLDIAQKNAWSLSYEFAFYLVAISAFMILRMKGNLKWVKVALGLLLMLSTFAIIYFHPRAVFFVAGVAVYYLSKRMKPNMFYTKYFALNGVFLLIMLYFTKNIFLSLVLGVLFFITVIQETGFLSKFLQLRPIQYFGDISYSFYLWHPFVLFPLKAIFSRYGHIIGNDYANIILFGILGLVLSTLFSHFSHKYIEVWFTNRYLKRKWVSNNLKNNKQIA